MTLSSNIIALRPAGFGPMPRLIPDTLDECLVQRLEADARAEWVVNCTQHRFDLAARLIAWRDRLTTHIDRKAQA